eukprot:scaffold1178_cov252-Pinguiococcus_pyrenoidosus.AAC.31
MSSWLRDWSKPRTCSTNPTLQISLNGRCQNFIECRFKNLATFACPLRSASWSGVAPSLSVTECRKVEGGLPILVVLLDRDPQVVEKPHDRHVSLVGGPVQGGVEVGVLRAGVRAHADHQRCAGRIAMLRGDDERSALRIVQGIDVLSHLKKEPRSTRVALPAGPVQRGHADVVITLLKHGSAHVIQELQNRDLARLRGPVSQRVTLAVSSRQEGRQSRFGHPAKKRLDGLDIPHFRRLEHILQQHLILVLVVHLDGLRHARRRRFAHLRSRLRRLTRRVGFAAAPSCTGQRVVRPVVRRVFGRCGVRGDDGISKESKWIHRSWTGVKLCARPEAFFGSRGACHH